MGAARVVRFKEVCSKSNHSKDRFLFRLAPAELAELEVMESRCSYPIGACLFLEQQKSKGIFLLHEGQVKIFFNSSQGKSLTLRIASANDVLGFSSALSAKPYEFTAETLQDCNIGFISINHFQEFLARHPGVLQYVAQDLAFQYQNACEQLRTISLGGSRFERVAQFLQRQSTDAGALNGSAFNMPFTHQEIAECTGITRESVTRALGMFKDRGLIGGRRSDFFISNTVALQNFAVRMSKPQNNPHTNGSPSNGGPSNAAKSKAALRSKKSAPLFIRVPAVNTKRKPASRRPELGR